MGVQLFVLHGLAATGELSVEVNLLCVRVRRCFFFLTIAVGFLSGLQVLKSRRFNTSSNLTLCDAALKP